MFFPKGNVACLIKVTESYNAFFFYIAVKSSYIVKEGKMAYVRNTSSYPGTFRNNDFSQVISLKMIVLSNSWCISSLVCDLHVSEVRFR